VRAGDGRPPRGGSEEYFETVAGEWEALRSSFFPDALRGLICDRAAVGAGALAVDVGAGSGFLSVELLARGARVIAVDRSPAMLAELERRLGGRAGAERLEVRVGSDRALPLADGEADAVVANMFLHHVESPPLALLEMARVLRPGGRLALGDLDRHEHEFLLTEQHDRWPGFEREEVGAWLRAAGFERISVGDARATCCSDSACGSEHADISIFVAEATRR